MEILGQKIAHKCYITTMCTWRALLQHHHVETVPWGVKPATELCLPIASEKVHTGKGTGWWGEEMTTQKYHSVKRRPKHAEMKLNSQTEGERNAFSLLAGCHSFPHLLSLKVKKPSPFHTSSRASFTAHIATSILVNRDSSLKASEAKYNFVTL